MPIYEYACKNCGNIVEVMQKISDPPPKKCERCGGRVARVMSQSSFQLKGGGWYKDLYSSSSGKKTGEKATANKAEAPKAEAPKAPDPKKAS